jgi:hypothetical protein
VKNGANFQKEYLFRVVGNRSLEICQTLFQDRGSEIILENADWKRILQESSERKDIYSAGILQESCLYSEIFQLIVELEKNPFRTKESLMKAAKDGCEEVKNWIRQNCQ